jgi:cytochrome c oxidase subunit IV
MRLIACLWILEAPYIGDVRWLIIVFRGFKINTRLWNYFSSEPLFSVSRADIFFRRSVWVSLITDYIPVSLWTISLISGQSRALTKTNARSRVRIVSLKILFILSMIPFRVRGDDIWHKTVIKWVHLIIILVLKSSALPRFFSKMIWSTVSMIKSPILSWYF